MDDSNFKRQINLTLNDGKEIKCECGNSNWLPVVKFFKFSSIITGTAKDSIMPVDIFLCAVCSKPCRDMLPKELQDKSKIDISNIVLENQ